MGMLRNLLLGRPDPILEFATAESQNENLNFMVDETAIDPAVFGLTSYADPVAAAPRIDRRSAIQVPAVKRVRDLIAGTLGGLPLHFIGPDGSRADWNLFDQPEAGTPRSVTMTRTIEDLLFEQVAWWKVTEIGWHKYPTKVTRIDPRRVTISENGKVYVDGKYVSDDMLIRFDSPNDGLLISGARAIRTCLHLESAAQRYSEEPLPLSYFTPQEGADPAEDEDIIDILNQWRTARQARATGYVPAALKLNTVTGFSPEQLQLADARNHAVLEIARLAGVDPEDLGVSTTSRTYANMFDRRKQFIDFTLGGYRQAIEDRLSMGDCSPRGYYAKFNLDSFLRSDAKTRMETYEIAERIGALTSDEIRELEDRKPLTAPQKRALASVPEPTQEVETA